MFVGMDHSILAQVPRHVPYRFHDQGFVEVKRGVPGHYFAAGNVFHHRQVSKPLQERQVGDVGAENFERNELAKLPLQFVREYPVFHPFPHNGFVRVSFSHFGNQSVFPHDPLDFLVVHLRQPHFDAPPAPLALAFFEDSLDFQVIAVILVPETGSPEPFVITAPGNPSQSTENTHIGIKSLDDPVFFARPEFDSALLARSLAKKSFSASRYLTWSSNRLILSFGELSGPLSYCMPPGFKSPSAPCSFTIFFQSLRVQRK